MNNLYCQRSFSEKFSVVFDWFNNNWKRLLKFMILFMLPVSLLQGFGQKAVLEMSSLNLDPQAGTDALLQQSSSVGIYYLMLFIGSFLCMSLCMALIKLSFFQRLDLKTLPTGTIWMAMKSNMLRLLGYGLIFGLVYIVLIMVFVFLLLASKWTLLVSVPFLIFISVALLPFLPVFILTDEPFMEAFSHSLKLGRKCWWGFFSTLFVMNILVFVFNMFGYVPFYLCYAIKTIVRPEMSGLTGTTLDTFMFLSSALVSFVSYFTMMLTTLIVCVQYGHAANKIDGTQDAEML